MWEQISEHPNFVKMLEEMSREWNSAASTAERVKIKAQTGLESTLEVYIRDIFNPDIPLAQRVEAGKFLARLGGLGERESVGIGEKFMIQINIGEKTQIVQEVNGPIIEGSIGKEIRSLDGLE